MTWLVCLSYVNEGSSSKGIQHVYNSCINFRKTHISNSEGKMFWRKYTFCCMLLIDSNNVQNVCNVICPLQFFNKDVAKSIKGFKLIPYKYHFLGRFVTLIMTTNWPLSHSEKLGSVLEIHEAMLSYFWIYPHRSLLIPKKHGQS